MEEPILIGREYILVYQPIVRRRRTSNVFWSTGLVKMSAQRRAEAIFVFILENILRVFECYKCLLIYFFLFTAFYCRH
jgi:hypothetical protein